MYQKGLKVAVIGAGMVGSAFAYAMTMSGIATDIVLVDLDENRAAGEAMDLSHGVPFVREVEIISGSYRDCAGSDIVVVTAGAAQRPGETRLDLVKKNTTVYRDVIPRVAEVAPESILLLVTNPVDVMTYVALKLSGFDKRRVIGSGTILDSARLKYGLSRHCEVDPRSVHAYIIGEHGDSEVPVWSLANIAGMRLVDYCPVCPRRCSEQTKDQLFSDVKNAAYDVIRKKGATYWAIGLAMESIVRSIVRDERTVMTVSTMHEGHLGVDGVCISSPVVVGREGASRKLEITLSPEEQRLFRRSAEIIRQAIDEAGVD